MSFWSNVTGFLRKTNTPDWGVLERYLAWAFGGGASASGIIVNPQTAMQAATVYSCIKVLAEAVGMLPCNVYRKTATGVEKAEDHPLWDLLHDQPNEFQSSVEFFEMLVMNLCLRGNYYAYLNRARSGRIVEILPLHPDVVRTEMSSGFQLNYQVTMPDGSFRNFVPGELLHVRGQTLNGWLGISPIAYAREAIGLALATEKFGSQLFRNGAKMGGVLEHPGKIGDEAYKRLKGTFDEAHSGENAHKTAVLEEGMKYTKVTMTGEDAQFLETRKYQRSEIAALFRVPPHMIGDLERATFSNIEQQSLDFVVSTLMPWLNRIEKAVKRDMMTKDEKKELRTRFNVAVYMRGDAAARSKYYQQGIAAGWLTRNEARAMESELGVVLNPLDGLDEPLQPLNMVIAGEESDPADKPGDGEEVAEPDANTKALVASIVQLAVAQKSHVIHVNVPERHMKTEIHVPERAVTVNGGKVDVHSHNQVNVPEREVTVNGGATSVNVPERTASIVVNGFPRETTETMERDTQTGELKSITRRVTKP